MSDPRPPDWVDGAAEWAGAYVHIPFCARICPYCDFAVVEGRDDVITRYIDAVCTEISTAPTWRRLDAIFVGGGTPSHVEASQLAAVLDGLSDQFGISSDAEVTLEANPEDWDIAKATELRAAGFTRVSFGAQSLDEEVLDYLGRRHSPQDVALAVANARDAGFDSVSVDLILGSPGETLESWRSTVDGALALEPDHVSVYALTVERGTPLGQAVASGAAAPDPDDQADKYEYAQETLEAGGLSQYEVSNYSKAGHECRYNLVAWAHGEYAAFGLGAHGHLGGERYWNVRRLDAYLDRIESGESALQGRERLDAVASQRERLILGLRRTAGVDPGELGQRWLATSEASRFVEAGILADRTDRLVVANPLMADAVARALVGVE